MSGAVDDLSIDDADPLWRRIHPKWYVPDGRGGRRLSSAAFENSPDGSGMSVTLGREAEAEGGSPQAAVERFPGYGLASLVARRCRELDQTLQRDPTEEDPHHALVNGKKTKRIQRELAKAASLLVDPAAAM